MPSPADREKALESALAQIDRQFGKGSVMRLGSDERAPVEVIRTSTDNAYLELEPLADLETLDLSGGYFLKFKGPGLAHLAKLKKLASLKLSGSDIDDSFERVAIPTEARSGFVAEPRVRGAAGS